MKTFRIFVFAVTLALLVGSSQSHQITWIPDEETAKGKGDAFDWHLHGPIEFLEHLRSAYKPGGMNIYMICSYHTNWVQESDMKKLRELSNSTERCLAVVASRESVDMSRGTTVGEVAMDIIKGHKTGGYPQWLSDSKGETTTPVAPRTPRR